MLVWPRSVQYMEWQLQQWKELVVSRADFILYRLHTHTHTHTHTHAHTNRI